MRTIEEYEAGRNQQQETGTSEEPAPIQPAYLRYMLTPDKLLC